MVTERTLHNRRVATSNTRLEKTRPDRYTKQAAQENLISLVGDGHTIASALDRVGRSQKAYEQWRRDDEKFKIRVDQARALNKSNAHNRVRGEKLGFEEFRSKYLKSQTFWHQLQWIDVLEGREPRDLHPNQQYIPGRKSRVLINTPPFHSKSTIITVDYVVYRLCMDPSFRVILVSQASTLAENFLYAIKQRLTHPDYLELQMAYAPEGGYKQTADSWKQNRIVVGADDRSGAEKDPSVQAIGMGGQIYGARADLVILDDTITGKNVREHEKQMSWIRREVSSRLESGGKLLVVGTRIDATDLYSELMNEENYGNGKVPWTYMSSPAILDEGATPEEHVTLWPYSDVPWQGVDSEDECDCGQEVCRTGFEVDGRTLYPRWDGIHLEYGPRAENSISGWELVYQQKAMHGDMVFPEYNVKRAINNHRVPQALQGDERRRHEIIAGCDPSIKGFAGLVVVAFDRDTGQRKLLNAFNLKAPTPAQLKGEMKRVTDNYGVNEWRVEKTGLLQFFTQDEELRLWMAGRGVRFMEHNTNASTKWDAAYGVASLAQLFGAYDRAGDEIRQIAPPLIELPIAMYGVKQLVQQLVTWTPQLDPKKVPQDLLMALWFVEVRCRELTVRSGVNINPLRRVARFAARNSQNKRSSVNIAGLRTGTGY